MTVWVNNPFDFLPGEGGRLQRYGLLCQALAQAGHRVVWWTSDWNHITKAKREVLKFGSSKVLKLGEGCPRQGAAGPGIEIRLVKTVPYYQNVSVRRLLSHWLYAKRWEKEALRCTEADRPDLILCSAPPLSTGWVMRRLCQRFACPGIIDVMDLWPETFERVAPSWMLSPLRWMARRVYEDADAISAVGDSYLAVVKRYLGDPQGKPLYRCYHGIEGKVLKCAPASLRATPRQGSSKVLKLTANCQLSTANLKLVYVGNMGKGYDLETLVRAVVEMRVQGYAITLDLAGSGEQEPTLKSLAQGKKSGITFHGVLAGEPLSELLAQSELGVVPMFADTLVAVPYKLADYAAYGLPMASSLDGETARLLDHYGCGWHYEAGDVASLKRTLIAAWRLKQEDAPAFEECRRQARRMAEELFDAERIYPAFVRWLEGIEAKREKLKAKREKLKAKREKLKGKSCSCNDLLIDKRA